MKPAHQPICLSSHLSKSGRRPSPAECAQIRAWGTSLSPRCSANWVLARIGRDEAKLLYHSKKTGGATWRIPLVPDVPRLGMDRFPKAVFDKLPRMF